MSITTNESDIEKRLVGELRDLKYEYRDDIRNQVALEANFREKFEVLNRVKLTNRGFERLRDGPEGGTARPSLRERMPRPPLQSAEDQQV